MFLSAIAVVGLLLMVLTPVIPTHLVVIGVVVVRSLSDIGLSTDTRPSILAWVNLGIVAVILYVVAVKLVATVNVSHAGRLTAVIGAFFIFFSVSFFHYGAEGVMTSELLRALSIVGIFALAYWYSREITPMVIALLVLPSVLIGLAGAAGFGQGLVNRSGRLAATFSHPNSAAAFFGIALVMSFAMWLYQRSAGGLAMIALVAAALLLTGSLGGIVGALAGIIAVTWLSPTRSHGQRLLQSAIIGACAYIGYLAFDLSARIAEFSWNSNVSLSSSDIDSFQWRLQNWKLLIEIAAGSPVFGYGLGASSHVIMPLGGPAHSMYIQTLVDGGIFGVCFLIALLGAMARSGLMRRRRDEWRGTVILGIFAFASVNGIVSNLLGYTAAMYLLAVLVAWLLRGDERPRNDETELAWDLPARVRYAPDRRLGLAKSGSA